jgi:hypothetical protein
MTTHQEYVDALKASAIATGKKVLIEALVKRVPFLFIPVIGPLVELIVGKLVEILIQQTEFAIFFKYIDMRVDDQGREFSQAAINNRNMQFHGTPEEKEKAEKELIEKFRAFAILTS